MKMHRYEEIWLAVSVGMLVLFMLVKEIIDPQNKTAPFDNPGIFRAGENEYDVNMKLQTFGFTPWTLKCQQVPK